MKNYLINFRLSTFKASPNPSKGEGLTSISTFAFPLSSFNFRFFSFLSLLFVLMISCEKEIDMDIEKTKAKLVVNAFFNTDSLWKLEVSKSKFILDNAELKTLDDAQVSIEDSKGNILLLENKGNGIYSSATEYPKIGETYTLEVTHNELDNVTATNQLPGLIAIEKVELGKKIVIDGSDYREVLLTFVDSPDEDYYKIRMNGSFWDFQYNYITGQYDSILVQYPLYFSSNSVVLENSAKQYAYEELYFTDEKFNGNKLTIDLVLDEYYFDPQQSGLEAIYISMSKISKDYYWYQTSYQKYLMSSGNPFAQPVQVYTNINNGFGVFAGYSTTLDSIIIQ